MKNYISEEIKNMIRRDSQHGDERWRVAERYGVSYGTVCRLVHGDAKSDWHRTYGYGKTTMRKF